MKVRSSTAGEGMKMKDVGEFYGGKRSSSLRSIRECCFGVKGRLGA